jgi:hypothetical protein
MYLPTFAVPKRFAATFADLQHPVRPVASWVASVVRQISHSPAAMPFPICNALWLLQTKDWEAGSLAQL